MINNGAVIQNPQMYYVTWLPNTKPCRPDLHIFGLQL